MRNESSRQLVAQVQARQEQPFIWQVDISNLNIHDSVKQLIINCYLKYAPFALSTEDGHNVVYFLPASGCAVWCDDGNVTLNTFHDHQQFQDCIKLVLVAHRTILSTRQIEGHEMYKEITQQIKSVR
jgi:hypothetical protein